MTPSTPPTVRFTWNEATAPDALRHGEVHVWRAGIDGVASSPPALEPLSADERARAARLRERDARARFIVGRAMVRERLGWYLATSPAELPLAETSTGKPVLRTATSTESVEFSISHSGNLVLAAFAVGRPVGVDVQAMRSRAELDGLAARFLAAPERDAVRSSPDRLAAFLAIWTLKEAYLKATGQGLAALGTVTVALAPGGPTLRVAGDCRAGAEGWLARTFAPAPGYVAAVVAGPLATELR